MTARVFPDYHFTSRYCKPNIHRIHTGGIPIGIHENSRDKTGPAGKNGKKNTNGKETPGRTPGAAAATPRQVERVTALRGQVFSPPRMTEKARRKLAERVFLKDSDMPYGELEEALRTMFVALTGRQDRAAGGLLTKFNDLEYRMDDLECELRIVKEKDPEAR